MSILIKGMEMPTHCMDCPFMVSRDNDDCILQSAEANENFENWEQMKEGCPLVPVPKHGRWVHGREVGREYLGNCLVGIFYDRWTCSECGYVVDDHEYSRINYKFCPECGTRMDGGADNAAD